MTNSLGEDLRITLPAADAAGAAQVRLWWTRVPTLPGETLGVIGDFAGADESSARRVLDTACAELVRRGCTLAVGPMDGNTWRKYRFVTDRGTEPPFFLEAWNPPEYPCWWQAAGFQPLAEYFSASVNDLDARDERLVNVTLRMVDAGITLRPLNPADFAAELRRIHDVSVVSFRDNYLYTPLPFEPFAAQYQQIAPHVKPELVLLAEHEDKPVGYVFALPDWAQHARGEPVTAVIVKTLAVLPGRAYMGLGAVLLGEVHQAARRLGFRRAIHAYMHESNKSRNLSARYGETIRRYTLFQKRLVS